MIGFHISELQEKGAPVDPGFGARLRAVRAFQSPEEFTRRIAPAFHRFGVMHLELFESGRARPSIGTAVSLAQAISAEVVWLVYGNDPRRIRGISRAPVRRPDVSDRLLARSRARRKLQPGAPEPKTEFSQSFERTGMGPGFVQYRLVTKGAPGKGANKGISPCARDDRRAFSAVLKPPRSAASRSTSGGLISDAYARIIERGED